MAPIHPSIPRPEGKRWDSLPVYARDYTQALERALERANDTIDQLESNPQLDPETARILQQDFEGPGIRNIALPTRPIIFNLGETTDDHDSRIAVDVEQDKHGWLLSLRSSGRPLALEPRAANVVHARPGQR